MVDSLRGGGFGSPGMGPFRTNTGGFGQYSIGGSGEDVAYLDKLEAQIAWQNGRLSDDAYLGALNKYVKSTEKGTSTHARAVDELEDTRWSIERNDAVRRVNAAATPGGRVNALLRLMSIDRRRLATMRPGNEQYEEQRARITEIQTQVRQTRYGTYVQRYNEGKITTARMQAIAGRFARQASGQPDAETYRTHVRDFGERLIDEQLQDALRVWEKDGSKSNARRVDQLYAARIATFTPGSARHKDFVHARGQFAERVSADIDAKELAKMQGDYQHGRIDDVTWLTYLRGRIKDEDRGSAERIRRRDHFLSETFRITERDLGASVATGERSPLDLIGFLESSLATMNLDSGRAMEVRQQIADLKSRGLQILDISQPKPGQDPSYPGHFMGTPPAGTPGVGFVSQFDGSAFAGTNCGMAAAAMLAWDVSGGKVRVSGGDMRAYSGDREGGTWVDDVVRAMAGVGIRAEQHTRMDFNAFRQRIANGEPALLTGTSGMLPPGLQMGYQGAHSVFVARSQKRDGQMWYFVMDPLGREGYRGQWWSEQDIYAFSWQGRAQGTPGSVVFAGRSGMAKVGKVASLPPFQAFDTDYNGRSTVGKGGGTSRAEAGARRDWSKGKPKRAERAPRKGVDDTMVSDFLASVGKIEDRARSDDPNMPAAVLTTFAEDGVEGPPADAEREARARELLKKHGGDPRLAAAEWFTGQAPVGDPSEWTQQQRWYGNAVAKTFGHEPTTATTTAAEEEAPELPPGPPTAEDYATAVTTEDQPSGVNPALEDVSRRLLAHLGLPATPDTIRTIAAWVTAENPDGKVQGNNPMKLVTAGDTDLDGQFGKLEDGRANFDTLEAGIEAAADAIRTDAPGLVGALRRGDPEAFARALGDSGWSTDPGYANGVVRSFNDLVPGTRPVIANIGNAFTAPTDLAGAVRQNPELGELMDVDPSDPHQMAWFKRNVAAAKEAAQDGRSTWEYESPDGERSTLPFTGGIGRDVLGVNLDYVLAVEPDLDKRQAAMDDYAGSMTDIDYRAGQRFIESAERTRDEALVRGDWTTAANADIAIARTLNHVLGNDVNATPDVASAKNPHLTDAQRNWLTERIEQIEEGSIVRMVGEGLLHTESSFDATASGMPSGVFSKVEPTADMFVSLQNDGSVRVHWAGSGRAGDADMFRPVTEIDANTGQEMVVPAYRSRAGSGLMPVQVAGGTVYQPIEQVEEPFVVYYAREYSPGSRSAQLEARTHGTEGGGGGDDHIQNLLDLAGDIFGDLMRGVAGGSGASGMSGMPGGYGQASMSSVVLHQMAGNGPEGQPALGQPAVAPDVDDGIIVTKAVHDPKGEGHPPIYRVTLPDQESGEELTYLSFDRQTWIGWVGDKYGARPPGLVAHGGATFRDGQLLVNGKPWTPEMGAPPIHWYGDPSFRSEDRLPASELGLGAPGSDYVIRRTGVSVGGDGRAEGDFLSADLTNDERYRAGLIDSERLTQRNLAAAVVPAAAARAETAARAASAAGVTSASAVLPRVLSTIVPGLSTRGVPGGAPLMANVATAVQGAATAASNAAQALLQQASAIATEARAKQQMAAVRTQRPDSGAPAPTPTPAPRATPAPTPRQPAPTPTPTPRQSPPTTTPRAPYFNPRETQAGNDALNRLGGGQ